MNTNNSHTYIITRLIGGLGNQMFQYAVGRVLSLKWQSSLKLDIEGYAVEVQGDTPRKYRLPFFNIKANIATREEVNQSKYPYGIFSKALRALNRKILRKYYTDYHPEVLINKTQYVDGFFQSEKYFKEYRTVLLEDFTLRDTSISDNFRHVHEKIKNTSSPTVSVHIRRGDYFSNPHAAKIHGVNLNTYYKSALSLFSEKFPNATYFVFSDDIEWVKENMNIPNSPFYVSELKLEDYEELTLMSKCTHNIIANSSFSWWGAWLNTHEQKMVVAPRQWTVKNTEHPSIHAEGWIVLDC